MLPLRARVAWAHDWVSSPALVASIEALPDASFVVNGTPDKNLALISAEAELRFANGISFLAKFDSELAGRSATYAGTGTLRYQF